MTYKFKGKSKYVKATRECRPLTVISTNNTILTNPQEWRIEDIILSEPNKTMDPVKAVC